MQSAAARTRFLDRRRKKQEADAYKHSWKFVLERPERERKREKEEDEREKKKSRSRTISDIYRRWVLARAFKNVQEFDNLFRWESIIYSLKSLRAALEFSALTAASTRLILVLIVTLLRPATDILQFDMPFNINKLKIIALDSWVFVALLRKLYDFVARKIHKYTGTHMYTDLHITFLLKFHIS